MSVEVRRQVSVGMRLCLSVLLITLGASASAEEPGAERVEPSPTPTCALADDETDSTLTERRFRLHGTCVGLSGSAQTTGQWASVPAPRFGSLPTGPSYVMQNVDARLDVARSTGLGLLKFGFEIDWSWYTSTGPDKLPNLDEATVSLAGFTVGFSSSLMNFWSSEFQFSASTPSLSTYLISKEIKLAAYQKLALAVEAGPPSSRGAASWQLPETPPYYSARWLYERDGFTFQTSVAAHETEVNRTPLFPEFARKKVGYAATAGLTLPLKPINDDDNASFQVTYAEDARVFLGTSTDRSALTAIIPAAVPLPTTGWSGLASVQHNWSDKWVSNAFASRLQADLDAALGHPSIRTNRFAANLIYKFAENWQIGAEAGYVDTSIDVNGAPGILKGVSIKAKTGFLWVRTDF